MIPPQAGKLFVETDSDQLVVKECGDPDHDGAKDCGQNKVAAGGNENVSEEKTLQADSLAGRLVDEENACRHAAGPDCADDGVFPLPGSQAD